VIIKHSDMSYLHFKHGKKLSVVVR
jgi:hypothetical protein